MTSQIISVVVVVACEIGPFKKKSQALKEESEFK